MLDVLIKNANIIDGTGKPAYKAASVFPAESWSWQTAVRKPPLSSTPAASTSAPAG